MYALYNMDLHLPAKDNIIMFATHEYLRCDMHFNRRFGAGLSYEDYEAIARHKLERQGSVNLSRTRKYPPGMTYEEIASSRSLSSKKQESRIEQDASPDRDSQESIEPIQEQDIKATGPDPYEKLNYKAGD